MAFDPPEISLEIFRIFYVPAEPYSIIKTFHRINFDSSDGSLQQPNVHGQNHYAVEKS